MFLHWKGSETAHKFIFLNRTSRERVFISIYLFFRTRRAAYKRRIERRVVTGLSLDGSDMQFWTYSLNSFRLLDECFVYLKQPPKPWWLQLRMTFKTLMLVWLWFFEYLQLLKLHGIETFASSLEQETNCYLYQFLRNEVWSEMTLFYLFV